MGIGLSIQAQTSCDTKPRTSVEPACWKTSAWESQSPPWRLRSWWESGSGITTSPERSSSWPPPSSRGTAVFDRRWSAPIVSTAALGPLVKRARRQRDAHQHAGATRVDRRHLARRVVALRQSLPIAGTVADRAVTAARERELPSGDRRAGLGLRVSCAGRAGLTNRDRFGDERPASVARLYARRFAGPSRPRLDPPG